MPKCPHCGEIYRRGQVNCYACGQKVHTRSRREGKPANPLIFIGAGLVAVVAVVGIFLMVPRKGREAELEAKQAKLERVRDSVRAVNRGERTEVKEAKEVQRLNNGLLDLEDRYRNVKKSTVGDKPTAEQQKVISRIEGELVRLRAVVASMMTMPDERREQVADSVRAGQREIRSLTSKLTRLPKSK